ncbi:putative efflux pump antibiotic resistance protein [Thozetella sp. PMI_491]|nr:putative efflux pump antibiotic resistance protein [Thozetella sp. PMI_491]
MTASTSSFPSSREGKRDFDSNGPKQEIVSVETPTPNSDEYPRGLTLLFLIVALSLGTFMMALDNTIVATAVPKITDEFHGLADVAWYSSAYFMTAGGFQPLWGKVYKYFPLKTVYLVAFSIFELGSLLCAVSPTSSTFVVGRAIAGIGAGGIVSGGYTLLAFTAEPKKRPMFTGVLGAAYGTASVVAPLIGGAFTDRASWRWCFYINLPLGGFSALIIVFFFHTPKQAKPIDASFKEKMLQMDPVGVGLAMGAVIAFILAMQAGGLTDPWRSGKVIGLLVGFVLIVVAFAAWELFNRERAMVEPRLIKLRAVWVNAAFNFFLTSGFFTIIYYLPIYFQSIGNVSPIDSGIRNLPFMVTAIIGSIAAGLSIAQNGITTPLMFAGAVIGTISCGLLYTLDMDTSTSRWIGFQIVAGAAFGGAFQIPIIHAQGNVRPADIPSATAIIMFLQTIGTAMVVSSAQAAFSNRLLSVVIVSAPQVNPAAVVATGATEIRTLFPADQVAGILLGYMSGIKVVFAMITGTTGISATLCLFSDWKKLDPKALETVGAPA